MRRRPGYHHGDLRAALVEAATELITERGARDFSMAEASRRLGVAVSAPYRHFADRDELLLAVGVRACELLVGAVDAETADAGGPPSEQLAAAARGYVRFAVTRPALFELLFGPGSQSWAGHPDLERAAMPLKETFQRSALMLADGDPQAAEELAVAVAAVAHGHAGLLRSGAFGPGPDGIEVAVRRAGRTVLALVEGRARLAGLP